MSKLPTDFGQFWNELKRRNVFRVATVYLITAWLIIQIAVSVFPVLNLPQWVTTFVVVMFLIGLPIALILAWAFEMSPEGFIKTTSKISEENPFPKSKKKPFTSTATILILVVALVVQYSYFTFWANPGFDFGDDKSIAVLPFENLSTDSKNDALTLGIHDILLTKLGKLSALNVIARSAMMRYASTTKSPADIAKELNVATIISGSVQLLGAQLLVSVDLIDASSNRSIWRETYSRPYSTGEVFKIQSEITNTIANALKTNLTETEKKAIDRIYTLDEKALNAYQNGKVIVANDRDKSNLIKAMNFFQLAIERDSLFAEAYAGLSEARVIYYRYHDRNDTAKDSVFALIENDLQLALKIDPNMGEAYASKGIMYAYKEDPIGFQLAFEKGLELAPNYALMYHWYGHYMNVWLDQKDRARVLLEKGIEIDPTSEVLIQAYGSLESRSGKSDGVLEANLKVLEINPRNQLALLNVGNDYYTRQSNLKTGIEYGVKLLDIDSSDLRGKYLLGDIFLQLGLTDKIPDAFPESKLFKALSAGNHDLVKQQLADLGIDDQSYYCYIMNYPAMAKTTLYEKNPIWENTIPEFDDFFEGIHAVEVYRNDGKLEPATKILNHAVKLVGADNSGNYKKRIGLIAKSYAILGDVENARHYLKKAADLRWIEEAYLMDRYPEFDQDPELKKLKEIIFNDIQSQKEEIITSGILE